MHLDIGHMIVSSVVHGLVYDVIFKTTRHLSIVQTAGLAIVAIAAVWVTAKIFGGKRR
ncbi:hypothetical protein [Thiomonas bhubaneswarensis]|uniref:Uncharacterized protein n=1 Tax=Thiomonas bhubaneswarensis TaxID=339866 RepID=A0A0K6I1J8_9BURK|nr:hypothetical protein [Thiomonas bhubaneswarensis]CUA97005.1 hypothetical protein Ga0061069_10556 [Thiomonas bhubaneswarensis]